MIQVNWTLALVVFISISSLNTWQTSATDTVLKTAQRTGECLSSVNFLGKGKFAWGNSQNGTCRDVESAFRLCDHRPHRECLLARIPWQTPVSQVSCCFRCCQSYWQEKLGLADIWNYWWNNPNPRVDPNSFIEIKAKDKGIPPLNSVVMSINSIRRFSLFFKSSLNRKGPETIHNATHLVTGNQGGGVVMQVGQNDFYYGDAAVAYVRDHPVSMYLYSDSPKIQPDTKNFNFEASGGAYFLVNGFNLREKTYPITLGSASATFEQLVKKKQEDETGLPRNKTLMCCCMNGRSRRYERVEFLTDHGACSDEGLPHTAPLPDYAARIAGVKFGLSPVGAGFACHRDTEVAVLGAVPVLDGHLSGGHVIFDANFPALHIPVCSGTNNIRIEGSLSKGTQVGYCHPGNLTEDWLLAEYTKLEARRHELDMAKVFFPYWLYHVFRDVPPRPDSHDGRGPHHTKNVSKS